MSVDIAILQVQPWGHRMQPVTVGRAATFLQAPNGQLWDNVRDAFWSNELNMCACEDQTDGLELMRATLKCVAEDIHRIDPDEMIALLFDGSEMYFRHYLLDLSSRDLLDHQAVVFKHATLSPFGWSVLAMLEATKPIIINAEAGTDEILHRSARIQRAERTLLAQ